MQVANAQGTFKPRDADEAHAWRLYSQYKQSKQKVAKLQASIKQTSDDIRSAAHGIAGGFTVDPKDVAALTRMNKQVAAERKRQNDLAAAWDKKFSGRYGKLADCNTTIYDVKSKRTMDNIEFRLRYFPFKVNPGKGMPRPDGVWTVFGGKENCDGGTHLANVTTQGENFRATAQYTNHGIAYSWVMTGTISRTGKVQVKMVHSAVKEPLHYEFQLSADGKTFRGGGWHMVRNSP
jgi:hypothetical protein